MSAVDTLSAYTLMVRPMFDSWRPNPVNAACSLSAAVSMARVVAPPGMSGAVALATEYPAEAHCTPSSLIISQRPWTAPVSSAIVSR